jgi:hypothetical protein
MHYSIRRYRRHRQRGKTHQDPGKSRPATPACPAGWSAEGGWAVRSGTCRGISSANQCESRRVTARPSGRRMGRSRPGRLSRKKVAMSSRCPQGRRRRRRDCRRTRTRGGSRPSASTPLVGASISFAGLGGSNAAAGSHPRHEGVCSGLYLASSGPCAGQGPGRPARVCRVGHGCCTSGLYDG